MFKFLISFLLLMGLSACTAPKNYQVAGAFFGANIGDEVLLTDQQGIFQQTYKLKDGSTFKFELPTWETKGRRFYLVYAYGKKPSLNTQEPTIKAALDISSDLYLPAILVYDLKLSLDKLATESISFNWSKPVFSQSQNSTFDLYSELPSQEVLIAQIPYEKLNATVNLSNKLVDSKTTLNELFNQKCKVQFNLRLPYQYPEGLKLLYTSNSIQYNFCQK